MWGVGGGTHQATPRDFLFLQKNEEEVLCGSGGMTLKKIKGRVRCPRMTNRSDGKTSKGDSLSGMTGKDKKKSPGIQISRDSGYVPLKGIHKGGGARRRRNELA